MKKNSIIISISVVAILGFMVMKLFANKVEVDSKKTVRTEQENVAVSVATAEVRTTSGTLNLVGTAMPDREVTVAAETSGKIVQVNFKLGDFVNAGSLLAKVDDTYKRLTFETAQLNYNKYRDDYERYQVLRQGDAVTEAQLRDIRMGYESAKIQLENAQKQLDDTKIVAPFSGVITSKNTELGAFVNMGTAIAGIADISQLKVTLSVSESTVYQLHKGQTVNIGTDIYPDMNYKGNIASISPIGSSTHTYPIEIMIANNGKNPLKAGTYVNVRVDLGKDGQSLMIPRDAIVSSVKDPSVYVVNNGIAQLTKITTGQSHDAYLAVTSGLKSGDKVVINGQINLTDGSQISVIANN
ncbi:MAG: efflux RND transporter periplasmic adaptor subunit [Tannerella sp.]|jgi:RND family efflux transporter MFP subunit|nr:efflux RND transporter periplasmic adaptor subunit [Tannerella sp.]